MAKSERTPMLEQFMTIKGRHPDAVLFYRMGDFYEMFYDDAQIASEVLGLRLTSRAHGKKSAKIPLAGFPYHQLDNYLTKMVDAGHKVVIVEQVEDPKLAKGLVKRDVVQIVTAGTNTAAVDREDAGMKRIAALVSHDGMYGYAWANVATGEFSSGEFTKEELKVISGYIAPVEIVIPESDKDIITEALVGDQPPQLSKLVDWVWEASFARKTLIDHFTTIGLKGFGLEGYELATCAAGALIYYLQSNLHTNPMHLTSLSRSTISGKLLIEPATRRNLELVDSISGNKNATLFAVIDKTVTSAGRRLLYSWMMEPLSIKDLIEERHDAVKETIERKEISNSIRETLRKSGDLQRYLARLATRRGSARDLVAIRETLSTIPSYKDLLSDCQSLKLSALCNLLGELQQLRQLLEESLVDEPPLLTTEGRMIRDGYHTEIDELRKISQSGRSWIDEYVLSERKKIGIPRLKISFNRVFGYYIEVSKTQIEKVPDYYIRKQTLVSAERFVTPELQEYEERLLGAEEKISTLESKLFVGLVEKTLKYSVELQENARVLAELDVLFSLGVLAIEENYSRPVMSENEELFLSDSRHPVVERLLPPGETFVPNDLELGTDDQRILIITGPNMAGKSTYLRQVALSVILAQMGSFVPAKAARIGIVDKLFTRIGAHDNLAGGESTFLIEMQETALILHNATNRFLVLIDEVGRCTSTFDGLSLAWSIVEYLHETQNLKPRTLFATHFHEMTDLEKYLSGVKNRNISVREYADKVVFLRKIIPGGCDKSFGIHVAQMAGLPPAVIGRAKEVMQNLEANDLTPGEFSGHMPRNYEDAPIDSEEHAEDRIDNTSQRLPKRRVSQLSLFDPAETRMRELLKNVDPNTITPIEALQLIASLKDELEH